MGHDAAIGVSTDELQANLFAVDQRAQDIPGLVAPGLVELRRVDVRQPDLHLTAVGINHETVAVLHPDDGLGIAQRSENDGCK